MLKNARQVKEDLIRWIQGYFEENGKTCKAVIGISGGKDSSVTAALCATALGKERVIGVMMPNGEQKDLSDAQRLVEVLKIKNLTVNIVDAVKAIEKSIESESQFEEVCEKDSLSQDSKINLPARIRMSTLYAVAQSVSGGGRVANTCNKSEDYVGYATKYGDGAGDFSPLANLLVEEVRQIGLELGLPKELVEKIPDDGLSGISDEEKLGFSYKMLDSYIQTGYCEDRSIKEKIDRLHTLNLHKLIPMPAFTLKNKVNYTKEGE
ncbi:MAG: NAD(+) synthase [Anaerostipes sp.]|nr:NAD(+) synthase [Anaerostipes sp.]